MNVARWIVRVLLALHTAVGAVWKLTNSEQTASLAAIPHGVWLAMSALEIACAIGLLVPGGSARRKWVAPIAAGCIAAEMLAFCAVHLASGEGEHGALIYWLVVAALCGGVAWGCLARKPAR